MSLFWIVLNVISAIILIAYIAYGIRRKKLIKAAKAEQQKNEHKRNF